MFGNFRRDRTPFVLTPGKKTIAIKDLAGWGSSVDIYCILLIIVRIHV
jgi:hypothetical protein